MIMTFIQLGRVCRAICLEIAYATGIKKIPEYEPLTMEDMKMLVTSNRMKSASAAPDAGALLQTSKRFEN